MKVTPVRRSDGRTVGRSDGRTIGRLDIWTIGRTVGWVGRSDDRMARTDFRTVGRTLGQSDETILIEIIFPALMHAGGVVFTEVLAWELRAFRGCDLGLGPYCRSNGTCTLAGNGDPRNKGTRAVPSRSQ